ncbi:MAG: ribonuclease III [Acidobacteriota bacterium]|jgi:ribonuclease-3|nr:ribonuclease III [Acidobacteriota bacterium]OQB58853.1 MAG: Ribonuclease 3 [Candidatus Aminicenantes bacterium ADurb.Bin147]HNQ79979.1 ribonuclease III [Candidatus Aminicenantes bacterium]MDD8009896.1 ribonuclease III [Acidobacteriota bacterium]MDD8029679.1 ribonuclease III [Acidobacteriota bacterium]
MLKKFFKKTQNRDHALEKRLNYRFKDQSLFQMALTHSSHAYETQDHPLDNERLEFLGDSVVGLIAADFFYAMYPEANEGDLSKFKSSASSTVALADYARQIKLDEVIHLGKGEEKSGGRKKSTILAGSFEALIGAIYIDGGFDAARTVYERLLEGSYAKVKKQGHEINNYKSALQEFLQKEDLPAPQYKMVTAAGPDHRKEFVVEVIVNKTVLGRAKGPSRKVAEQKAAENVLKSFFGKRIKSLTPETFLFKS